MYVFNRTAKRLQRERALLDPENKFCEYIKEEVGNRLFDNILDIKREFQCIVELGCGRGYFSRNITPDLAKEVIMCDSSSRILEHSYIPKEGVKFKKLIVDEEDLPFEPNSIDLVASSLSLHWVNDLPKTFSHILSVLRNDGVFMASMFGGDTLYELRSSIQLAEGERCGGISPHVSPFAEIRDIGNLLTTAGFTMLTIDTDEIVVGYPSIFELMWDLKGMGENNSAVNRCGHLNKDVLLAAAAIYENMYGEEGKIRATFKMINFIAWKPDPSQPKPIPRGSGEISLKDIENLDEIIKAKGFIDLNEKDDKK